MEHKKLDNIFQKQLENLEIYPNENVWNTIESKLSKKKRRVFPFWWFSGSVAAILVLGLLLYPSFVDETQKTNKHQNEIITTIPEIKPKLKEKIDPIILNKEEDVLVSKKNNPIKNHKKIKKLIIEKTQNNISNSKEFVKGILLSYRQIDKNMIYNNDKPSIIIQKSKNELKSKKLDLNNFSPKNSRLKIKKTELKNWSVAPVFALLKSNSFTNTSPINENLANSTKGENTYSYGLQIAYKINQKWSIQSGIHLQEMSYSNNQINVSPSIQSTLNETQFANGDSFSFLRNNINELNLSTDFINTVSSNGNLNQNYGYIEIPVEVKYNFSRSSKFETQLVTGFSSLFLNKNEVILNTDSFSKTLEVTNLNKINFSGNLGFDFNYLFDKNWSLNLNPMLKVQINTFNKNANGFAPFNLGIYSGVKYKF